MSLWPRSLFGRVAAIMLAGLAVAYAMSFWSVMRERSSLADSMMQAYLGRDVASSLAMLERLPPSERPLWLERLARPNYWFLVGETPAAPSAAEPSTPSRQLMASLRAQAGAARVLDARDEGPTMVFRLRLADGSPLSLHVSRPRRSITLATATLLLCQLAVLAGCVWWAVRVATRPLSQLADAAARLGTDPESAAMPEQGPTEVQRAATAFNAMQRRIGEHMAERLQILAAVSHDLQTPITRMRVRTDLLADGALRDKLQADLQGMQHLVEEGLAYARTAHAAMEKPQAIDLHALLDGLVCDYADAGHDIQLQADPGMVITTRPQALKRVVGNLVDNALKFAGQAEVLVRADESAVVIRVVDRGPGMPDDQMVAALRPFYRLEGSRNRETGGSGLGLAIAQRLSTALGADLRLSRRDGGGLEARLSLPAVRA